MTVENFPDRRVAPDKSQQVLFLLNELSDRLRKAEAERDAVRRELMDLRESIQDLDDRNSQTQKALLAFENKFDSTETNVETVIRRLTGVEESLDRQNTELLGILRKIEDRFEAYDREYKNHAASIEQYADTLDRFDKKLEKLMQDKGRISRKLDALEFQLADAEERMGSAPGTVLVRDITGGVQNDDARVPIQVWTPETARPQFMKGPGEAPRSGLSQASVVRWSPQLWQYLSVGLLVVLLGTLAFGVIYALARHPNIQEQAKISAPPSPDPSNPAPATRTDVPAPAAAPAPATAAPTLPEKDFFSKSVRSAMDQQVVAARKIEDDDTARLMAMADTTPLSRRLTRDGSLPRVIKAIEAKAFDGNVDAQHDMGAMYSSGQSGVGIDYIRAAKWFRAAAEGGNANARYNLGVLYQQGLGVEKDVDQALSWYRSASLLEHPEARYNLGIAYVEGIGVGYNPAMAAGYFEQAARAGVIESAYNLGMILENGLIDEPRPFEALFWYKLASDGGSSDGLNALNRLMAEQKVGNDQLSPLFDRMLAERPDIKALAESRRARSIKTDASAPRIRIHTPDNKTSAPLAPNIARKLTSDLAATGAPENRRDAPIIRMLPPPSPDAAPAKARKSMGDPQMIARVQAMLIDEGLYNGKPDGLAGPATIQAIRRYQTKYEMDVDGIPSTTLMAQMLARRLAVSAEPAAGDMQPRVVENPGLTPPND